MSKRYQEKKGAVHKLTPYEFNYLKGLAQARNRSYNEYQSIISTFLAYLAGTNWNYKDIELDFEFNEEDQTVTVTPHAEE